MSGIFLPGVRAVPKSDLLTAGTSVLHFLPNSTAHPIMYTASYSTSSIVGLTISALDPI